MTLTVHHGTAWLALWHLLSVAVLPALHYDTNCPSRCCLPCTMTPTVDPYLFSLSRCHADTNTLLSQSVGRTSNENFWSNHGLLDCRWTDVRWKVRSSLEGSSITCGHRQRHNGWMTATQHTRWHGDSDRNRQVDISWHDRMTATDILAGWQKLAVKCAVVLTALCKIKRPQKSLRPSICNLV